MEDGKGHKKVKTKAEVTPTGRVAIENHRAIV